jgi:high-affinity iron transporter
LSTGDQGELEEQRGFADEVLKQLAAAGPEGEPYVARAKQIQADISASKAAPEVTTQCGSLARAIVLDQALVRAPKQVPSLEVGKAEFEKACASCHGVEGKADTDVAKQLDPPPANFHDAARMSTLTPYKVFNTTSFGIPGTAMAGFSSTPEEVRWAQAFHVFTLRQAKCDHTPPTVGLVELATSTDVQLAEKYGAAEVACLRRVMPKPRTDTQRTARSRSPPSASLSAAIRLIAQTRAAALPAATSSSAPSLPWWVTLPSTRQTWPARNTRFPVIANGR